MWVKISMAKKEHIFIYSRVHISSDTAFLKILKKPSIVQEKMLPDMNLLGFFHTENQKKKFFFEQPNNQKPNTKKVNKSHFQGFINSQYF